jgi:hypothetical protein
VTPLASLKAKSRVLLKLILGFPCNSKKIPLQYPAGIQQADLSSVADGGLGTVIDCSTSFR